MTAVITRRNNAWLPALTLALAGCSADHGTEVPERDLGPSASSITQGITTTRSIDDFVERQGKFCLELPASPGECHLFTPPIQNFFGFAAPQNPLLARVDYAGLADEWIRSKDQPGFGTSFSGKVTERALADGRAEVHVILFTENALSWVAEDDGVNGVNSGLVFGARAPDVLAGATPVLGSSRLEVTFINARPGDEFPDLVQLLRAPEAGQEMHVLKFFATAQGDSAELQVTQVGVLSAPTQRPGYDGFPAELIMIHDTGN